MLQFNFDATKGETPASIAQKRALVAQIMGSSRAPQNVGEGFSAIGDGIVANVLGRRAEEGEAAGQASAQESMNPIYAMLMGQGAGIPATASDAAGAMAGGDFLSGLVNSESGGNWQALNDEGYGGRLQFGDARLADAARAGVIPAGMTGADFSRMPPEVQQAVEQWHFGDIDQQAANMGLNQYFGQTIGGVPINADSIRAMAHLGGIGGAQRFIESGGRYNPADSNGTRLSDYGTRFGGGGSAPTQVAQGPDLAYLMQAASNPWLNDSQKSVINSMIAQQMEQSDPRYQQQLRAGDLGIQKAEMELEALRNPAVDPWSNTKVINDQVVQMGPEGPQAVGDFRTQDQYRQLTPEEIGQRGLDPNKVWQVGPDNKLSEAGGSLVTVNTGDSQTPGWKKIDEAFAPLYFDWQAGGWADTGKQVDQLNEALGILESGQEVTGPMQGAINRLGLGALFNQDGTIAKENVEEVVQRSLREILGAQFTENEGQRLIARAFNDQLPPAENAKRVRRLLQTIQGMADSKQAMVDHFNANGTLYGYQGKQPTLAEIRAFDFGDAPGGPGQPNQSQAQQISTQEQYDALPSGSPYLAPDGTIRTKR